VKTGIPQEKGVEELIGLIKADGRWVDPPEGYTPPVTPAQFNERITVSIPLAVK